MARAQKVKPHFIVFYHDLKHPLREPWNTRTTPYEIWKEYHDDIIFDAPYYSILGYFDTRQEAKQFVQQHKLQAWIDTLDPRMKEEYEGKKEEN